MLIDWTKVKALLVTSMDVVLEAQRQNWV